MPKTIISKKKSATSLKASFKQKASIDSKSTASGRSLASISSPLSKKSKAAKTVSKPKAAVPQKVTKKVEIYTDQKDHFLMDAELMNMGLSTRSIHGGNTPDPIHGGVCPPIDLSTTFAQPYPGKPSSCFDYTRCGNPTILALQRNLACIEKGKYALALNTGMAAIISVLSLLKQGDHLLCIDDVYGGTQRYLRYIFAPQTGLDFDMIDMQDLKLVRNSIKKRTRIVWIETPTNPTLKYADVAAIAKICKEKGALLVIDNTFMSPVLQNPLKLGADIVMHSMSKYIGGHSDVLAGCLIFNDSKLYDQLYFNVKSMGTMISPFNAWLALRGSKTLKLRVERAADNALELAKMLEAHPKIEKVLYPGLPSHPHHKTALKCRSSPKYNGGSGMIGFYVKGDIKKANKFLSSLKLIILAESLGGCQSLIESPALMTHGSVPPAVRKSLGIDDNYVRFSTGVEDVEDLVADLKQALAKI